MLSLLCNNPFLHFNGFFFQRKGNLDKVCDKKRETYNTMSIQSLAQQTLSTDHPLMVPMMSFADQMRGLGRPPHPSNQLAGPNGCHHRRLPTVWDHPGRWEAHSGRASRHDMESRSKGRRREDTVHCHSTGPGWADCHVWVNHNRPSQGMPIHRNSSMTSFNLENFFLFSNNFYLIRTSLLSVLID